MEEISLPLIINGKVIKRFEKQVIVEDKERKIKVMSPEVTEKDIEKIARNQRSLAKVPIDDIISFYSQVGELWRDQNYDLRKESIELTSKITGYHPAMVEYSYRDITRIFNEDVCRIILDIELGDPRVLDIWIHKLQSKVHAVPTGRLLHILAGNVPVVSAVSMVRGNLTKNVNILKLPSGDPVTALYLALSFRDVDKDHLITKTTSVVYWQHDSPAENKAFEIADGVCVWGGYDAVLAIRKKSKPGQILLEYGPRRGYQFISREVYEDDTLLNEVAKRSAFDLILYDQQACHSPQVAFVEEPAEKFCEALAEALKIESKKIPKGYVSTDEHATISHQRLMATFRGDRVYHPGTTEWTIILTKKFEHTLNHPLSRTLFVIEVKDLRDALRYVDPSVMVVAFSSKSRMDELKDEVTLRGADRVTLVGRMGYFPTGSPHEGRYDLSNLVRWVSRDLTKGELKIRELLNKLPKYRARWVRVG